jgi:hypothetical protein
MCRAEILIGQAREDFLNLRKDFFVVRFVVDFCGKHFHFNIQLWLAVDRDSKEASTYLALEIDHSVCDSIILSET